MKYKLWRVFPKAGEAAAEYVIINCETRSVHSSWKDFREAIIVLRELTKLKRAVVTWSGIH